MVKITHTKQYKDGSITSITTDSENEEDDFLAGIFFFKSLIDFIISLFKLFQKSDSEKDTQPEEIFKPKKKKKSK